MRRSALLAGFACASLGVAGCGGLVPGVHASATSTTLSKKFPARLLASQGVVVDCAAVVGLGRPGLPQHAEIYPVTGGPGVWNFPARLGRFEVYWLTGSLSLVGSPSVYGPAAVQLLPPAGAAYGVAVPGMLVPENRAATWTFGPGC